MSTIYIYSPSGAVRDMAAFRRGVRRLQSLGHDVEVDPDALRSHLRFAGDDDARLAAIGRAAASRADFALITRGGYGLSRLLPRLPYRALAKAVARGTRFVGQSDFTAFQNAVLARTGAVTWSGPALLADFGERAPNGITEDCFADLAAGRGVGAGWRLPRSAADTLPRRRTVLAQDAVLWGGNLTMLCSLVGTPYLPEVQAGVLFLEDVAEHPYRIERMLSQLLFAGVLARQRAVLLGQFTDYKRSSHDNGYTMDTVAAWLRRQLKIPVLTGLPFGHVPTKICLPVGARIALVCDGQEALLLWGGPHA